MRNLQVTINDPDQCRDYVLLVDSDSSPPEPELGFRGSIDFYNVRCIEIVSWCGKIAASSFPGLDPHRSTEHQIGQWCAENYSEEITEQVADYEEQRQDAGCFVDV